MRRAVKMPASRTSASTTPPHRGDAVLRQSNLRVVQNLLGHESMTTTTKYAHALTEDIRATSGSGEPHGKFHRENPEPRLNDLITR